MRPDALHAFDTGPARSAPMPLGANEGKLQVKNLSHAFGLSRVLDDVSFIVPTGSVASLLGPSGCGKSTILRSIAGLVHPKSGSIALGGDTLDDLPTRRRQIGLVFQNYALFPHLTVRENVGYGLARLSRADRRARVDEMLEVVRLAPLADRLPRELSGGQQQRVAVARAIAPRPRLLLLDEPFAALDKDLRLDLQIELVRLQKRFGITTLLVTHDQEEALSISDQVIVMRSGVIEQGGAPADVYDKPKNLFVSSFVGRSSILRGTQAAAPEEGLVRLHATGQLLPMGRRLDLVKDAELAIIVRPEHLAFCPPDAQGAIPAIVQVSLPLGPIMIHELGLADGTRIKLAQNRDGSLAAAAPRPAGTAVHVRLDPTLAHVFPASPLDQP